MLRTFFRSATGAAVALLITAASTGAQGWSVTAPIRSGIDAACKGHESLNGVKRYELVRFSTFSNKKLGAWMQTDAKRNDKIQASKGFLAGDYVTIFAIGDKIVSASMASSDVTGDGGVSVSYCYISGALALGMADLGDVTDEMEWTHKQYYANGKMIAESVVPRDLARNRTATTPPTPNAALAIPAYTTPALLPYYAAFKAARTGTLRQAE